MTNLWLLRLAMSRTVCAVSEAKSRAPATGLVTVPTSPLPRPEKKPLTPPSVLIPSTVEVMILVMPPMIPKEGEIFLKRHANQQGCYLRGQQKSLSIDTAQPELLPA